MQLDSNIINFLKYIFNTYNNDIIGIYKAGSLINPIKAIQDNPHDIDILILINDESRKDELQHLFMIDSLKFKLPNIDLFVYSIGQMKIKLDFSTNLYAYERIYLYDTAPICGQKFMHLPVDLQGDITD